MTPTDQVLVPREATEEMLRQFSMSAAKSKYDYRDTDQRQREGYADMIAAAPKPDIEAMVEGVAKLLQDQEWGVLPIDRQARAVLRHLLGVG